MYPLWRMEKTETCLPTELSTEKSRLKPTKISIVVSDEWMRLTTSDKPVNGVPFFELCKNNGIEFVFKSTFRINGNSNRNATSGRERGVFCFLWNWPHLLYHQMVSLTHFKGFRSIVGAFFSNNIVTMNCLAYKYRCSTFFFVLFSYVVIQQSNKLMDYLIYRWNFSIKF